jgi:hypothetical protein
LVADLQADQLTTQPVSSMFQRALLVTLSVAFLTPSFAAAQPYSQSKPRRQFVTISLDWLITQPLHFLEHPLQDLVGTEVAAAQFKPYEYETRDGLTHIDVLEFSRRGRGGGITVYPLGINVGTALGIRASVESLPNIRVAFDGPGSLDSYTFTDGRAYDVGVGLFVADRSSGWGLGSRAFVLAGGGRIRSSVGDGTRVFAEGGGGLSSGPLGVELSVKFAWNRLDQPVAHRFLTIPITLRGTLSF